MEQPKAGELTAEQQRLQLLVFQGVGAVDILLGAVLAFLGPGFIGGAPLVDTFLQIGGAILAASGIGIIWWARTRTRRSQAEPGPGSVFKVDG